jgi:hypothetical protein
MAVIPRFSMDYRSSTGTSAGLRRLNQPRPAEVRASPRGEPLAVTISGRTRTIAAIQDRWRIDDLWWRKPISRAYFALQLEDGRTLTLFHDLHEDTWALQAYG